MEHFFVYCIREQGALGKPAYFKTKTAAALSVQASLRELGDGNPPGTVFMLGPFLDLDEARLVENQLCSLFSEFRALKEVFYRNPLAAPQFWAWVDAQILSVHVYEDAAIGLHSRRRSGLGRLGIAPPRRFPDAETRDSSPPTERES